MAEIAKRAGVSKGVISYHFAGKRELIEQVVNTVMEKASAVMLPRIYAEHSAAGMLRAYIESNLEFIAAHRNHILAMMNIAVGARDDRKPTVDLEAGVRAGRHGVGNHAPVRTGARRVPRILDHW